MCRRCCNRWAATMLSHHEWFQLTDFTAPFCSHRSQPAKSRPLALYEGWLTLFYSKYAYHVLTAFRGCLGFDLRFQGHSTQASPFGWCTRLMPGTSLPFQPRRLLASSSRPSPFLFGNTMATVYALSGNRE